MQNRPRVPSPPPQPSDASNPMIKKLKKKLKPSHPSDGSKAFFDVYGSEVGSKKPENAKASALACNNFLFSAMKLSEETFPLFLLQELSEHC